MITPKLLTYCPSGQKPKRMAAIAGVAGLMVLAMPSLPIWRAAYADTAHAENTALTQQAPARQAILNHPSVSQLRAQICQFNAQVDVARAGKYPQVDFRLIGGTSLTSKFRDQQTRQRRFDDREVDAVIGLQQNVFDWGLVDSSVQIAETNRVIAKIDLAVETDRQTTDLLVLLIRHSELSQQDKLYQSLRGELEAIANQIEEGVNAGALTLTDLRQVKINNLDIEVAHLQVMRELSILEADLGERFQLTIDDAIPFLREYANARPSQIPDVNSNDVNEVRKLNLQQKVTGYELDRLVAQRKPSLTAIVDTTLFDVDGYNQEYEVAGRFQLNMPLFDGGSNRASRREVEWRSRSIVNERSSLIRSYDAQMAQIKQSLIQLDQNIARNNEKITATTSQLEAHLAREGQTLSEPSIKASLLTELNQLQRDHISLESERERELMRGFFFTDAIGGILNLSHEVATC